MLTRSLSVLPCYCDGRKRGRRRAAAGSILIARYLKSLDVLGVVVVVKSPDQRVVGCFKKDREWVKKMILL